MEYRVKAIIYIEIKRRQGEIASIPYRERRVVPKYEKRFYNVSGPNISEWNGPYSRGFDRRMYDFSFTQQG